MSQILQEFIDGIKFSDEYILFQADTSRNLLAISSPLDGEPYINCGIYAILYGNHPKNTPEPSLAAPALNCVRVVNYMNTHGVRLRAILQV